MASDRGRPGGAAAGSSVSESALYLYVQLTIHKYRWFTGDVFGANLFFPVTNFVGCPINMRVERVLLNLILEPLYYRWNDGIVNYVYLLYRSNHLQ